MKEILITEITVSRGKTINMGDYESERYDVSITERFGDEGLTEGQVQIEILHIREYLDSILEHWMRVKKA